MNINNLKKGMIIKNYKELCNILDIKVTTGNAKKSQLTDLLQYCQYHKEGNKFIIDSIYSTMKPKEDKRQYAIHSKYAEDIQDLLLYTLYNLNDKEEICWSCNTLLHTLSMINSDYITGRKDMDKLSNNINMNKEYVYDFYNNSHKSLKSKLETALNILSKKALIICEKVLMIVKEQVNIKYNDLNIPVIKDGKVLYETYETISEATKEEKQLVLRLKHNCFNKLDLKNEQDIITHGKWSKYETLLNEEFKNQSIKYCYYAYKITFNKEDIKSYVIGDLGEIITKVNLNKNIVNCLLKGATTRHNNTNKVLGTVQGSDTKIKQFKLRKSDDYIKNNKILVDKLIKPNNK